jgi:hypothetical protein|tara:strand:- start:5291 stop:5527 length:237 start_codon:yes stop_codon:yes gene_type:complete
MSVPPIIVDQLTIESLALDDIKFTLASHPICCLILSLTIILLITMSAHFTMLTYNSCKKYENQGNQTSLIEDRNFSRL